MRTQQKKPNSDQLLVKEAAVEKEMLDLSSVAIPELLSLEDALRELQEVREDAEEAYASDDQIDPVPDSAYVDAHVLLELLHRNLPMPDMMWSEDGGLGFEWRPGSGIATISLYGDDLAIYGVFFDDKRQVDGICSLSDTVLLQGFLTTLRNLFE
jgi:hypothetical protein